LGDMLVRAGLLTPDRLLELERRHRESGGDFEKVLVHHAGLSAEDVHQIADLVTRDTIFTLLRWTRGSFHFTSQKVTPPREDAPRLPAEQILMDGLRMVDEWRAMDPVATRPGTVFQRVGRFEAYRDAHAGAPPESLAQAERVFYLIDGRLTARRVIDLSRLGDFDGARLLSRLHRAGVIEPVGDEALARSRRRRRIPELEGGRSLLGPALAGLPFLLLAGVVWTILAMPAPVPPVSGLLDADPAQRTALAFERLRLRHAVEAHRLAEGNWPRDLSQLGRPPARGAMASRQAAPYYYAQRGPSFVVLAPREL
ncbi:MAG: DUF4388 domain-containing protein, partial [Myxococcota bacterium]|nr:DUF4388 domain-containing protein [Myxococcota bacterium]